MLVHWKRQDGPMGTGLIGNVYATILRESRTASTPVKREHTANPTCNTHPHLLYVTGREGLERQKYVEIGAPNVRHSMIRFLLQVAMGRVIYCRQLCAAFCKEN